MIETVAVVFIVLILFAIIFAIISFSIIKFREMKTKNQALSTELATLSISNRSLEGEVNDLTHTLNKTVHQKKSSEVRLGKIGENLAPFTEGWPWDSNNFRFIGNPIDGIQFTEEEIIFVEIKTGKSRLSKGQSLCRDLIKNGKVRFVSFRIDETGTTLKEE